MNIQIRFIAFGLALIGLRAFAQVTSLPTVTVTPSAPLPANIAALASEEDLMSYALMTARTVDLNVWSQAQVGNTPTYTKTYTGSITPRDIAQAITAANLQIKLSSSDSVTYSVSVHDVNYKVSLYGSDTQTPVLGKGGYVANFKVNAELQGLTFIQEPNLSSVKLTLFDSQGKIKGTTYLDSVTKDGFYFPSDAAGKVIVELFYQNGTSSAFDLRSASAVNADTVALGVTVSLKNVEYIVDKAELNLIPITSGGVGDNVLGVVELTKQTTVSVAGQTTEGGKAVGFKYRSADALWSAAPTLVPASPNGIAPITLGPGKWHVIAVFPESALKKPEFYYYPPKGN